MRRRSLGEAPHTFGITPCGRERRASASHRWQARLTLTVTTRSGIVEHSPSQSGAVPALVRHSEGCSLPGSTNLVHISTRPVPAYRMQTGP